jgi:hypothetical protein
MKGRDFVDLWAERNGEEVYQRELIEHGDPVEQNEKPQNSQ